MSDVEKFIYEIPFYENLSEKEKKYLSENVSLQHFEKGNVLGCDYHSCVGMIRVLKGCIRVFILSEDGREITLFRIKDGENCIMGSSCVMSVMNVDIQLAATEETSIIDINQKAFGTLTSENIYVKAFMYEFMSKRFGQIMLVMQEILFMGFDRRLAVFLVEIYENTGNPEIRMTQEAIAEEVNSAREVVARKLKRFSEEGLIEVKRGKITIKDADGLRMLTR